MTSCTDHARAGSLRTDALRHAVLAATMLISSTVSAQTMVAGWIDPTLAAAGGRPEAPPVRIMRNGAEIVYDANDGLRTCDRLKLVDPNAVVRITLSNKERLRLDAKTLEVTLPCDPVGVTQQLAAFLRGVWGGSEKRRMTATAAASRTNARTRPLIVPALAGERTELAAGERALFLAWKGGRAPFALKIARHDDDRVVATLQDVRAHVATFPSATFVPGRYVLTIADADGRTLRDEQVFFVAASTLPALPSALTSSTLGADAKKLYYADLLAGSGDGRFCLEALQQAASIAPRTPAAQAWLNGWIEAE